MIEIEKKNIKLMRQLRNLLGSEIVKLDYLIKNKDSFNFPAVYVFSKPNFKKAIYVGRTKTLPLRRRMIDHKKTNGNSDLNMMIKGKASYSKKIGEYKLRYLKIEDSKERMFFESFAIALLQPELNKYG